MRIGIEAQRLFRPRKHGMDVFALNLIRQLQNGDSRNEYVVFVRPDEDDSCIKETDNLRIVSIKASSYVEWEQVRLPIAAKREGIDLLHCTANTGPVLSPVPIVLSLHDLFFLRASMNANPYQVFGNRYRAAIVGQLVRSAARVVTVSDASRQEILLRFPKAAAKLSYIHHGLDENFKWAPGKRKDLTARHQYSLPREYFLCLGNTDPRKNTCGIVAGYAEYVKRFNEKALPLVVTGLTSTQVAGILHQLGASLISPLIVTPGYISAEHFPSVYAMSKGLIFTSLEEGFGFPILEAMASMTPVITSCRSAIPEIAGESALYADPTDPGSLATALRLFQTQPGLVRKLIDSGFSQSQRFSWNLAARRYRELYHNAAYQAAERKSSIVYQAA